VWIPTAYMLLYCLFALIYYLVGGVTEGGDKFMYPFLDFDNLGYTLPFIAGGIVGALPCQALVWFPYRCRVAARRGYIGRRESLPNTHMGTSTHMIMDMSSSTEAQMDNNKDHSTLHI
ncbi:unnamed protein product, partial [Meganyctiphanes norvegica]